MIMQASVVVVKTRHVVGKTWRVLRKRRRVWGERYRFLGMYVYSMFRMGYSATMPKPFQMVVPVSELLDTDHRQPFISV